MWLDLVPISHRACVHFAADRQNPSGDSARCCLAADKLGSAKTTQSNAVVWAQRVGQWSGLPRPDESDHPHADETAVGAALCAGLGLCLVLVGFNADS